MTSAIANSETVQTVISYPYSGDYRIDALILGATVRWGPDIPAGNVHNVSFSFARSWGYLATAGTSQDLLGFAEFSPAQKVATRSILATYERLFDLHFTEVTEVVGSHTTYGDIRFADNTQTVSAGYTVLLSTTNTPYQGDVFISNSSAKQSNAWGTYEYMTLLHEIGHALGLKHPGNYNAGSNPSTEPGNYLGTSEDTTLMSIMSYNTQSQGLVRQDLGPYDLLALGYLYGRKLQNTGNDVYAWTDAIGAGLSTLIDDGGQDTLDLSALTTPTQIDLREGHSSSAGRATVYGVSIESQNNVQMAFGTVIETVIGSPQADEVVGNAANNRLSGRGGNDTLDGGAGVDTAVYRGPRSNYTIQLTAGSPSTVVDQVSGRDGQDTLLNIERLAFADDALAYDLQGPAGLVAELLGAVFGRDAVANRAYVGIGLYQLDTVGLSNAGLATLALQAKLGPQPTSGQVVDLLYTNLVGQAPPDWFRADYVARLGRGEYTQASLTLMAAGLDLNQSQINLTGLKTTGLAYTPYVSPTG